MTATEPKVRRVLQHLVMPTDADPDIFALYMDPEPAVLDLDKYEVGSNRTAKMVNQMTVRQSLASDHPIHPDQVLGRRSVRVTSGDRLSFGTYFNAFPASYWRRWTIVDQVTLTLTLEGAGAAVTVFKSMANGRSQRVDHGVVDQSGSGTFTFELTLKPFVDGGWYWFDVVAADADVIVKDGSWSAMVPESRGAHGRVAIGITTMNRPDFCAELLAQIGEDPDLRPYLDEVFVAEQGTQKVTDSPTFDKAKGALGDLLRVVEQENLGGSGGYARGQLEALKRDSADYFMCMDDDVVCEPEGIIRAVTFGDLARRPTIVGGHMFSLYSKSRLHSFGEVIQPWRFWWQSAETVVNDWDFRARNLRSTRWLHARVDVDYNGWFMALIPLSTLKSIGLSLPAVHQVGRLRVRPASQGGRGPDGLTARRRGLAHPLDGQERRAGLAVVLPPAQPVHRGAAAQPLRPRGPDRRGSPSTTRSSTWCRCSTPRSSCGTRRSRTSFADLSISTRCWGRSSPRSGSS